MGTSFSPSERRFQAAAVALLGAVVSIVVFFASSSGPQPQTVHPVVHSPEQGLHLPPLGVYAGPGAVAQADSFLASIHGSVRYAFDFLNDSTWQDISDPTWNIAQWRQSGFKLIWGVPMLPATNATLAQGASGRYQAMFRSLAELLVSTGQGSSIIDLGWNAADPGAPWSVSSGAEASQFVEYWRNIVAVMRSVPGGRFAFTWQPGTGESTSPVDLYPGAGAVDYVGTDVFDQLTTPTTTTARWRTIAAAPYGLNWLAAFASSQGKTVLMTELGLVPATQPGGAGDDPTFVADALIWSAENRVAVDVIWDYGTWDLERSHFPFSLEVVRQLDAAHATCARSTTSCLASLGQIGLSGLAISP